MQHQIRTVIKHENTTLCPEKERGSRHWQAAEIMSSTWFVVESSVEVSGENEITTWVTSSIVQAAQIQRSQKPYNWSQIFVCMRAPLSIRNATIFEVVMEAYQADNSGTYVLRLANGMSFIAAEDGIRKDEWPEPKELKLLYAHHR